jgi:hypothetical protein
MRELPILFKAEMHRAIRERRKTETRRLVKMPKWAEPGTVEEDNDCKGGLMAIYGKTGCFSAIKPRYQVGDRLWVKEAWAADRCYDHLRPSEIPVGVPIRYLLENPSAHLFNRYKGNPSWYKKRSPLHMPKWAARTWLEVTGVRAERLQEITEEGAIAEGVPTWDFDPQQPMTTGELGADSPYRGGFAVVWDDINEKHTWKSNPWVWVYQFKLLEAQ